MPLKNHLELSLHTAITHQNSSAAKVLIHAIQLPHGHLASLSNVDKEGRSFFALSLEMGLVDIAEILLEHHKSEPSVLFRFDNKKRTPLWYAANKNYPHIASKLILRAKVSGVLQDLLSDDKDGISPLLTAIYQQFHEIILIISEEGTNLMYGRPHHLENTLADFIERQNMTAVASLLPLISDPKHTPPLPSLSSFDAKQQSFIHFSAIAGTPEITRKLFSLLKDDDHVMTSKDAEGNSVLWHLTKQDCTEEAKETLALAIKAGEKSERFIHCLDANHHGVTPVHNAIAAKNITVLKSLINFSRQQSTARYNWLSPNAEGNSALHLAVIGGDLATFNLVLSEILNEKNADIIINMPNLLGNTALHLADPHKAEMRKLLIANGASRFLHNNLNETVDEPNDQEIKLHRDNAKRNYYEILDEVRVDLFGLNSAIKDLINDLNAVPLVSPIKHGAAFTLSAGTLIGMLGVFGVLAFKTISDILSAQDENNHFSLTRLRALFENIPFILEFSATVIDALMTPSLAYVSISKIRRSILTETVVSPKVNTPMTHAVSRALALKPNLRKDDLDIIDVVFSDVTIPYLKKLIHDLSQPHTLTQTIALLTKLTQHIELIMKNLNKNYSNPIMHSFFDKKLEQSQAKKIYTFDIAQNMENESEVLIPLLQK